jgi:hypothetical protein
VAGAGVKLLGAEEGKVIGWIKNHWHDPVWSAVIATVIGALLTAIPAYLFDWWPVISRAFALAYDFMVSSTAFPNWSLGILLIPLVLILTIITVKYLDWRKYRTSKQIYGWQNYTSDTFFGIKWYWHYDNKEKIEGLYSLCPHCNHQIYPAPDLSLDGDEIDFHCENCNSSLGSRQDEEPQKVIRHIQRKIRTGEYLI